MKFFIIILVSLISTFSYADKCVPKMDLINIQDNIESKLSFLKIIDEERWKELTKKHDIDTDFFGFGMDINGDSTYQTFKKEREKVFKKYSFDSDFKHASSYITSTFSDNAKEAYIACWEQNSTNGGVFIFPEDITDKQVVLRVKLVLPPGVDSTNLELISITPEALNNKKEIQLTLNKLKTKGTIGLTLNRDKTKDLNIQINSLKKGASGFNHTNNLLIASVPKYVPPEEIVVPPIEKPLGVTAIAAVFRGLTLYQLPDNSCGLGGSWTRYGWHGKSKIEYCSQVGRGNRYLAEMRLIAPSHAHENCAAKLGNQWENYAWDGKHKTFLCKRMVSFDVLKLGRDHYIESLSHSWPGACLAPKAQVVNVSGVNFCGVFKTIQK